MNGSTVDLLARFAEPEQRAQAATELARRLGVDSVLFFVRDPEIGVLLPALGFPQTIKGGPLWRAFLKGCADVGTYRGEVDLPPERLSEAVCHVAPTSAVAVALLGGVADGRVAEELVEALPLLGALFRAELDTALARAEAEMARVSGRNASDLAVALDSARAEVEHALAESARLNAELQETDRRKDDFMAMLGHELRNPMAAIAGAIEVMRAAPENGAQIERARGIIERQTEQLARLVDDLLDVARITRGKIVLRAEPLAIEPIARRAVESTHTLAASKRHEVVLEVRADVYARADRTRLEQMITNLLTNALKYTDPGGRVVVVVDREGRDATVAVQDNGIGIAPAMLPRIFDAFLQVDAAIDRGAGGLGVGLTVVSRLAALHGGRVHAASEEGKGSTFTIYLPEIPRPAAAVIVTPAAVPAIAMKQRVLVVDDNLDSAEMMVSIAQTWGHDAFHAADGRGAVAMAHELVPDIVLLDIGLPGMDGYEVAARLRADPLTRSARIVAVSGYGLDADRLKSRAAGCDEHLVKPVDMKSLKRVLGRA